MRVIVDIDEVERLVATSLTPSGRSYRDGMLLVVDRLLKDIEHGLLDFENVPRLLIAHGRLRVALGLSAA